MNDTEVLKIQEEVRQLKARYFRFTDSKDWEGLATVFARDGVLGDEQLSMAVNGREAVVDCIDKGTEGVTTVHHGHCHEVWVDSPDAAHGTIAFEDLGFSKRSGELVMHGYGRYNEKYIRENGEWRILESRIPRMAVLDRQPR
jgi:SnoaL-like domain